MQDAPPRESRHRQRRDTTASIQHRRLTKSLKKDIGSCRTSRVSRIQAVHNASMHRVNGSGSDSISRPNFVNRDCQCRGYFRGRQIWRHLWRMQGQGTKVVSHRQSGSPQTPQVHSFSWAKSLPCILYNIDTMRAPVFFVFFFERV